MLSFDSSSRDEGKEHDDEEKQVMAVYTQVMAKPPVDQKQPRKTTCPPRTRSIYGATVDARGNHIDAKACFDLVCVGKCTVGSGAELPSTRPPAPPNCSDGEVFNMLLCLSFIMLELYHNYNKSYLIANRNQDDHQRLASVLALNV